MDKMQIPYIYLKRETNFIHKELLQGVEQVIDSGWFLNGNELQNFETEFSNYCGTKACVGTGNGLDALKIILLAYKQMHGWNDGDEVIVPAHTFIASALSIVQAGLKPVFCDVRQEDYLLNAQKLSAKITPKTKAVVAVHLYGKLCDMPAIKQIASQYNLKIIEDAAQAHGATDIQGLKAGNIGDAAAFSFYPTKNLGALGDAGAIVTNDLALANLCRKIANYGQTIKYQHDYVGVNSRMDEIQAAILRAKLSHLDENNSLRAKIAHRYLNNIQNPCIHLPYQGKVVSNTVWHIFPIFCTHRDQLQNYLRSRGIDTLIHYPIPPHLQKAFIEYNTQSFPMAEKICKEELSIPLYPSLSNEEIEYIIQTINQFVC